MGLSQLRDNVLSHEDKKNYKLYKNAIFLKYLKKDSF